MFPEYLVLSNHRSIPNLQGVLSDILPPRRYPLGNVPITQITMCEELRPYPRGEQAHLGLVR
jgi:hypothetical protein